MPALPTAPTAQLQHTPLKSPPLGQTTALSPSSSGCTLIIPLLGRAKVSLGSMLGKEKGQGRLSFLDFMSRNMVVLVAPGDEHESRYAIFVFLLFLIASFLFPLDPSLGREQLCQRVQFI